MPCQAPHSAGKPSKDNHLASPGRKNLPAIVLAAFGTTSDSGRATLETMLRATRQRYPGHAIYLALTAKTVIARLRARGIKVRTLKETLALLQQRGFSGAVLQSLMIAPGATDAHIAQTATGTLRVTHGEPLLSSSQDIAALIDALTPDIPYDRPTVFILHGSKTHAQGQNVFAALTHALAGRFPDSATCNLTGAPGFDRLSRIRDRVRTRGAVHFVPMLLTVGHHVQRDIMGDAPHSLKNRLAAPETTCAAPLGDNPRIRSLFFRHLDAALRLS
jgi:sirohydrochlorin cobaltochelatase